MNGFRSGGGELVAAPILVLIAYPIGLLYHRLRPNSELLPLFI